MSLISIEHFEIESMRVVNRYFAFDLSDAVTRLVDDVDPVISDLSYDIRTIIELTPLVPWDSFIDPEVMSHRFLTHNVAKSTVDCDILAEYCAGEFYPRILRKVSELDTKFLGFIEVKISYTTRRSIRVHALATVLDMGDMRPGDAKPHRR